MSNKTFWGRYDIRAIVNDHFNKSSYFDIGTAYALFLKQRLDSIQHPLRVGVGYDARLHSPELARAMIDALLQSGVDVIDLGLSTSPIVYFSEHLNELDNKFPVLSGAIIITASHNPAEYNGVKFTFQKRPLDDAEYQALQSLYYQIASKPLLQQAARGTLSRYNILPEYLAWFREHFGTIGSGIKVIVDSGNATAGIIAPDVLRTLGCEVIEMFSEPDGRFPNHHPDPCVYENLTYLAGSVVEAQADFGVAFDGDADRLGIVDNHGRIMPGDQITLFLSDFLLEKNPGATIVFDIKSTQTLFEHIQSNGGKALLAPSGHAFMKRTMRELDIPLGGELSGHIFFRDRHWGFDDALYAACRFLETLASYRHRHKNYHVSDFVAALPQTIISEEIRLTLDHESGRRLIADLTDDLSNHQNFLGVPLIDISTVDGLRVNMRNGFFLIRQSNTEPCVTLRFEAENESAYGQLKDQVEQIRSRFQ